jgi:hypothetical protein
LWLFFFFFFVFFSDTSPLSPATLSPETMEGAGEAAALLFAADDSCCSNCFLRFFSARFFDAFDCASWLS